MNHLTDDFSSEEFACPDRCGAAVKVAFVRKLQRVRDVAGPMIVESGARCARYQGALYTQLGRPRPLRSAHVITEKRPEARAADIRVSGSRQREKILRGAVLAGFTRIGIGKTFIHLDDDPGLPSHVCWLY